MTDQDPNQRHGADKDITDEIGRKAARKEQARRRRQRSVWFGFGMFGIVGWSIAAPTILGVLLGLWLDVRFPGRLPWTLICLVVGVVLGCINAWYWIIKESRHD